MAHVSNSCVNIFGSLRCDSLVEYNVEGLTSTFPAIHDACLGARGSGGMLTEHKKRATGADKVERLRWIHNLSSRILNILCRDTWTRLGRRDKFLDLDLITRWRLSRSAKSYGILSFVLHAVSFDRTRHYGIFTMEVRVIYSTRRMCKSRLMIRVRMQYHGMAIVTDAHCRLHLASSY